MTASPQPGAGLRLPGRPAAELKFLHAPQAFAEPSLTVAVTDCHQWRHLRPARSVAPDGGRS